MCSWKFKKVNFAEIKNIVKNEMMMKEKSRKTDEKNKRNKNSYFQT